MQIIIRQRSTEAQRRKGEAAKQILRHYHEREIRDGSRTRLPVPANQILKVYKK